MQSDDGSYSSDATTDNGDFRPRIVEMYMYWVAQVIDEVDACTDATVTMADELSLAEAVYPHMPLSQMLGRWRVPIGYVASVCVEVGALRMARDAFLAMPAEKRGPAARRGVDRAMAYGRARVLAMVLSSASSSLSSPSVSPRRHDASAIWAAAERCARNPRDDPVDVVRLLARAGSVSICRCGCGCACADVDAPGSFVRLAEGAAASGRADMVLAIAALLSDPEERATLFEAGVAAAIRAGQSEAARGVADGSDGTFSTAHRRYGARAVAHACLRGSVADAEWSWQWFVLRSASVGDKWARIFSYACRSNSVETVRWCQERLAGCDRAVDLSRALRAAAEVGATGTLEWLAERCFDVRAADGVARSPPPLAVDLCALATQVSSARGVAWLVDNAPRFAEPRPTPNVDVVVVVEAPWIHFVASLGGGGGGGGGGNAADRGPADSVAALEAIAKRLMTPEQAQRVCGDVLCRFGMLNGTAGPAALDWLAYRAAGGLVPTVRMRRTYPFPSAEVRWLLERFPMLAEQWMVAGALEVGDEAIIDRIRGVSRRPHDQCYDVDETLVQRAVRSVCAKPMDDIRDAIDEESPEYRVRCHRLAVAVRWMRAAGRTEMAIPAKVLLRSALYGSSEEDVLTIADEYLRLSAEDNTRPTAEAVAATEAALLARGRVRLALELSARSGVAIPDESV
jgi:hypothetical protein